MKLYCGNAKTFKLPDGEGISVTINLTQMKKHFESAESEPARFKTKNGDQHVKLTVFPLREVGKYGDTHSVSLNTWKPEQKEPIEEPVEVGAEDGDDLPF